MRSSQFVFVLLAGLATVAGLAQDGRVLLYVSPSGDDGATGDSEEAALRSITEAIARARASEGADIVVLPGNYSGETETFPLDPPPRTHIRGHDPQDKPSIGGTFAGPVFWIRDIPRSVPEDPLAEIPWPEEDDEAVVFSNLRIQDGGACSGGEGGALRVTQGSILVEDCELVENHAGVKGGGMFVEGGSKVIARRCRIAGNYPCGGITPQGMGAFAKEGSVLAFEDCVVEENRTFGEGGRAGVSVDRSHLFMRDCRVLDNFGTAVLTSSPAVALESCVIGGHPSPLGAAALTVLSGRLSLRHALIYGNGPGRGVVLGNTPAVIDGCVVAYNNLRGVTPGDGGEALLARHSPLESDAYPVLISNSIFWANNDIGSRGGDPLLPPPPYLPTVIFPHGEIRHSIVQRGTPPFDDYPIGFCVQYVEVLEADPMFVNALRGDFRLRPGSPAIDAGDPASPLDSDGTRRDLGVHFDDIVPHPILIRGDANGDSWTEVSDAVTVLLALFVDPSVLTCHDAADYDDDGIVELADAISLLDRVYRDPCHVRPPEPPYPIRGVDWTNDDALGCDWRDP